MPATFTSAFASRLNSLCKIEVKEAQDGDILRPGVAYLAPGGKQMMFDGRPGSTKLKVIDGGDKMNYKPCVDVTFGSAAKIFSDKVLSMILTGMGLTVEKVPECLNLLELQFGLRMKKVV